MNIAVIINTLLKGGAEKQSILLAKTLQLNHKVFLVIIHPDQIANGFQNDIQTLQVVELRGNLFSKMIHFYKFLRREKVTVIFSFLAQANAFNALIGKLASVPHRVGGIRSASLHPRKLAIERIFHNHFFSKTVTNNYAAVDQLIQNGFIAEKFAVIHNTIQFIESKSNDYSREGGQVLTVARFTQEKDLFTAIQSVNQAVNKIPDKRLQYTLVGYGPDENKIRQFIEETNSGSYIELVINPENLTDYYKKASVFLLTSVQEGMSNVIMEAMMYKLPIVATNVGDNKFLIDSDQTGFLCKPGDFMGISEKIIWLFKNQEFAVEMGKRAYYKLKKEFTIEVMSDKYESLIHSLAHGQN